MLCFWQSARASGVALLAAILIAGVGANALPRRVALASVGIEPLQARECPLAKVPDPLPDIAALVDVEPFRRALVTELAGVPPATAIPFSLRFSADARQEWLVGLRSEGVDVPLKMRVQRLLAEYLRRQPPADVPWSLRLDVIAGDSIQLRVSRSEVCPVEPLRERSAPGAGGTTILDRSEMEDLQRAGPVTIGVDVDPTGRVLGVELLQSSRSRMVDDQALKRARESKYRPALVDGIPVASRYEFKSRTRVRVRSGRLPRPGGPSPD